MKSYLHPLKYSVHIVRTELNGGHFLGKIFTELQFLEGKFDYSDSIFTESFFLKDKLSKSQN